MGETQIPIQCVGVVVPPGDLILAEDDGVAVVTLETAPSVLDTNGVRRLA